MTDNHTLELKLEHALNRILTLEDEIDTIRHILKYLERKIDRQLPQS